MKKRIASILIVALWCFGVSGTVLGQSDAQQREAAAKAYDRGTAAYLAGDFAKAAQWFETANRMAPAAAALMQAIRAHKNADNRMRAATLALQLQYQYPGEAGAVEYANGILEELEVEFYRIDVTCDNCTVDLNGALQEYYSFFVEPETPHTLVAHFETGDVTEELSGAAGDSRMVVFEAPAARTVPEEGGAVLPTTLPPGDGVSDEPVDEPKPLPPYVTFIAGGVTVALGVVTVVVGLDAQAGAEDYETKTEEAKNEPDPVKADELRAEAEQMLEDGQSKETMFNVFIGVTGAAAVGTAVIALLLTDWSGEGEEQPDVSMGIAPTRSGGMATVRAEF
jgi:hypothetical protein